MAVLQIGLRDEAIADAAALAADFVDDVLVAAIMSESAEDDPGAGVDESSREFSDSSGDVVFVRGVRVTEVDHRALRVRARTRRGVLGRSVAADAAASRIIDAMMPATVERAGNIATAVASVTIASVAIVVMTMSGIRCSDL
jgi:hypothetical protein